MKRKLPDEINACQGKIKKNLKARREAYPLFPATRINS
jgi:hypothetical protein